jgi:hypothetical protein
MNSETSVRGSGSPAVWFSAALCGIALVANIAGMAMTGRDTAGMIPFLCFLPMAFWFTSAELRRMKEEAANLRERIARLEKER